MIKKIQRRIRELSLMVKDEGMDGIELLSLQSFRAWIKMVDDVVQEHLILSLTPSNEIYVSYRDDNERISLIFHGSGLIKILDMGELGLGEAKNS